MRNKNVINKKTIAITAAGTAGHIEPALAVARELVKLQPNLTIYFIGGNKQLEKELILKDNYVLETISAVGLPRKLTWKLIPVGFKLIRSIIKVKRIYAKHKTVLLIGFGAYVSLPCYLAAKLNIRKNKRIPIVIHEANRIAGIANRIGAKFADKILSQGETNLPAVQVGIPLRSNIVEFNKEMKLVAKKIFNLSPSLKTLLVFGGSQGAHIINEKLWEILTELLKNQISVIHLYGSNNTLPLEISQLNQNKDNNYIALPYFKEMHYAYAAADLVISRSGMMTVAEIAKVKIPTIFIPLAHGNGEQSENPKFLVESGAALIKQESELTGAWLLQKILFLLKNSSQLTKMAMNFPAIQAHNSAYNIASIALSILDDINK